MKCKELIKRLETIAPIRYAEKWDNVGLIVGDEEQEVHKIIIALDPSTEVIEQAIEQQCDMIITHHPLIFSPMKKITNNDFIGKRILRMMNHSIAYYAMHTNMDISIMADESAKMIGIKDMIPLEVLDASTLENGIGRFGRLAKTMTLLELAEEVKKQFHLEDVRVVGDLSKEIRMVAISTGSGEDYVGNAIEMNADVLITGDIRHHKALDALERNLTIIDAGHYGTERFMVEWLADNLGINDITVMVANEQSPFKIV
ncbi:Nif3-like dinuclear metal center hexameric protein [Anaerosporobacter sp.]|uniref:Nif3-like dinuclear metal center hexameric protein n=1 Tax=Anaerosporobacter sp. TaxID=1872529 RepID=UPI00286F6D13|nr:Nif3-like dinuclear metal center hexameric protein [Anaerosporobacter sp.]